MIENITRSVENLTKSSSTYENISKTTIISAKIDETVKINGIFLTVKNVKTTKLLVLNYLGEKKSFPSKDDYKFVMLFVILNNTGPKSESIMFSVWNKSIITDKGYLYEKISDWEIINRYGKSRKPIEIKLKEYNFAISFSVSRSVSFSISRFLNFLIKSILSIS